MKEGWNSNWIKQGEDLEKCETRWEALKDRLKASSDPQIEIKDVLRWMKELEG
jgi:hypothetical protein